MDPKIEIRIKALEIAVKATENVQTNSEVVITLAQKFAIYIEKGAPTKEV